MNIKPLKYFLIIYLICSTLVSTNAIGGYPGNSKGSNLKTNPQATFKRKNSAKKYFNNCCRGTNQSILGPAANCTRQISNTTPFKFNNLCMSLIDEAGLVGSISSDEYFEYLLLKKAEEGKIFANNSGTGSMCSSSAGETESKAQDRVLNGSSKFLSFCYSKDEHSNLRKKQIDEMSAETYIETVLKENYPSSDSKMPNTLFRRKKEIELRSEYCHKKGKVYPEMDSELGEICITEDEADTLGHKLYSELIQKEFEEMLNFCDGNCAVACEKKIQKVCSKMYPLMALSRHFHYNVCNNKTNRSKCRSTCIEKTTTFTLMNCSQL